MVGPSIIELQQHMRMVASLGRNDKCWCGSGKKFKKCHLDRENQTPLTRQEVLERFNKPYEQGHCFHPGASASTCKGKTIKAHTIRRNGDLKGIARDGEVNSCLVHGKFFDDSRRDPLGKPHLVGVGKASTFAGFCSWHDDQLFAPLEKDSFKASPMQIALLGYRAICHEIYLKECALAQSNLRCELDKGYPPLLQLETQKQHQLFNVALAKGIEEIESMRDLYARMLSNDRFEDLHYYVVEFGKKPEVVCNATRQATHDFRGQQLFDLRDFDREPSQMAFGLFRTDIGGAAVFSWPEGHKDSEQLIATLDELPDTQLPHAILRFAFEFAENTYFSPEWWDSLPKAVQIAIRKRQLSDIPTHGFQDEYFRKDDCLLDDGIRAVDWPVISRRLSIDVN